MPTRLIPQLAALGVKLRLEPDPIKRLILRIEIADTELQMAHMLAKSENAEPLAKLVAQVLTAQVTTDTAGAAIARDPALAGQLAAVALPGAQTGDVAIGQAAGGNIINITIGERAS
jgi:hypothetical protein